MYAVVSLSYFEFRSRWAGSRGWSALAWKKKLQGDVGEFVCSSGGGAKMRIKKRGQEKGVEGIREINRRERRKGLTELIKTTTPEQ